MKLPLLLLLTASLATAQVATGPQAIEFVTAFHGPAGGFGALTVFEEASGAALASPAWAREIRLRPIDCVGRTELGRFAPDVPRYRADVPGASRLELPEGRGTLFHYERAAGAARWFGYLLIQPDGRPKRLLERPAIGVEDPFVARVAVDTAGRGLLLATTVAAGGDLLELDLIAATVVERTAALPAQAFSDAGLWLGPEWGLAVSAQGVLRFDRDGAAAADFVPFPDPAPAWFSGEAVLSPNRSYALVTAGVDIDKQQAYVIGALGTALQASRVPTRLSGAGFLPEANHGPYMAVTDDGELAAWRAELQTSREARVARLVGAPVEVEVTGDDYFLDTIDEVGQVYSFNPDAISMSIGSLGQEGTIEKLDVFDVRLDAAGAPEFTNRSMTSGDGTAPFDFPGTISAEHLFAHPDGASLVIYDENDDRLLSVDAGGLQVLRANMKELYVLEPGGDHWLVGSRNSQGNKPGELFVTSRSLANWTPLAGGGEDVEFFDAVGDGQGQVLLRRVFADTQNYLMRVDLPTDLVQNWNAAAGQYAGPFAFTRTGAALFTEDLGVTQRVVRWGQVGPATVLDTPPGVAFVLR